MANATLTTIDNDTSNRMEVLNIVLPIPLAFAR